MKKFLCFLVILFSMTNVMANLKESKGYANSNDPDFMAGKNAIESKDWKSAVESLSK